MNCTFLLFLDFDGVLHPFVHSREELFSKSNYLKGFLDKYENIKVIVSSGWRRWYSLDDMKKLLPPWLSERVEGVIPTIDVHPQRLEVPEHLWLYPKHAEGYLWSLEKGLVDCFEKGYWLALEKHFGAYEQSALDKHVVITNESQGLEDQDIESLECKLQTLLASRAQTGTSSFRDEECVDGRGF